MDHCSCFSFTDRTRKPVFPPWSFYHDIAPSFLLALHLVSGSVCLKINRPTNIGLAAHTTLYYSIIDTDRKNEIYCSGWVKKPKWGCGPFFGPVLQAQLDDLFRKGVYNSVVIQERLENTGYDGSSLRYRNTCLLTSLTLTLRYILQPDVMIQRSCGHTVQLLCPSRQVSLNTSCRFRLNN